MRGVTAEVELPFRLTDASWNSKGLPRLGAAIEWSIDRQRYGIGSDWRHSAIPNFLANEIAIEIFLWTKSGEKVEGG